MNTLSLLDIIVKFDIKILLVNHIIIIIIIIKKKGS